MATESPIRISETTTKWPAPKNAATFAPSSANAEAGELGLLRKAHNFHGSGKNAVPNRSGSAPPSMEGSFLAIDNLISRHNSGMTLNVANLDDCIGDCESEDYIQKDPAYLTYYHSSVDLNPRLPRHIIQQMQRFGNNWELTSLDDGGGNGSLHLSQVALSTHKEESEDDPSPQHSFDGIVDKTNDFWSGKDAAGGQNKVLVDTVLEDFPRTSSHVYNQSHSLGYGMTEEAADHGSDSSSLQDLTFSSSNTVRSTVGSDNILLASKGDLSAVPVSSSLSSDYTGAILPRPPTGEGTSSNTDFWLQDEVVVHNASNSDIAVMVSKMKDLNMSLPNSGSQINLDQHQGHQQQSISSQVQGAKSQLSSQGVIGTYNGMDQFHHGPSKFPTVVQPVLQTSGFTPPLYATAAAYVTSSNQFYPNVQAPGFYSPLYGLGGYPVNSSIVPPFFAGYPQHGAIPFGFDGAANPNFRIQTSGVSTGGSILHGADTQQLNKFYGQIGFAVQPSFDPCHVQYFQQPFGEAYNVAGQLDPLASRSGVFGSQTIVHGLQKGSDIAASDDQKFQHQRSGGPSNPNLGKGAIGPHYLGNQTNRGILMQYPSSPVASPVLPGSPLGGASFLGGRHEVRVPPGSGKYSGWQSQRGFESYNDPKIYNFLEELKSGKGRRFELSDITGHIVEFSSDQHGSRFIQQKLESCTSEEKASVFKEVLPHASKLMTDVFGNYVIQKFFEYGNPEQRKELANQLVGQILPLSLQMYGCRVIQKALEVIELEQKAHLVRELDGHVMRCVRDQNGNHVIQKCIESIPAEKIGFIISAFRGQVATLSVHPYGCRVIQRVLERCTDEHQCQFIVDEILDSVCALAQDQYGNYVTQHVLERGRPPERSKIIGKLSGHIVQLSQHKFASNVIEKCLEYGGCAERELIIDEIIGHNEGSDNLLIMMKDQFANYVVQKIFEICTDAQQAMLLSRIRVHAHALKKYTYGKHIVARFELLLGEENQS